MLRERYHRNIPNYRLMNRGDPTTPGRDGRKRHIDDVDDNDQDYHHSHALLKIQSSPLPPALRAFAPSAPGAASFGRPFGDAAVHPRPPPLDFSVSPSLEQVGVYTAPAPLPFQDRPGPHDVICGRGKLAKNHSGNVAFRRLIQHNLERYSLAGSKTQKSGIVAQIIAWVRAGARVN